MNDLSSEVSLKFCRTNVSKCFSLAGLNDRTEGTIRGTWHL
ncbi:hypothetical protein [Paraburkholderia sprentiae]|nr:hypothetical protein [Paraburkholderia sprentiae]